MPKRGSRIRYPQRRKSPIRHTVRAHRREGFPVRSYARGHGSASIKPFSSRRGLHSTDIWCKVDNVRKPAHCEKCESHEPRQYTVSFKYVDGDTEVVKTVAHSPKEAMAQADKLRVRKDCRPTEVTCRNLIGQIVGKLAGWGVGGAKALWQTYKETRAKAKKAEEERRERIELAKAEAEEFAEENIKRLKKEARAGDKVAQRYLRKKGIEW